jgi:hypothetical protein
MKKILITEEQFEFIKDNNAYINNNNVEVFSNEIRKFLHCIITNSNDKISDYWRINNINKGNLVRLLKKYGLIIETDNSEIIMPKKNFEKKINRVYSDIFTNDSPGLVMTEDGENAGTSCSSVSGSYEPPLFCVRKK